MSFGPVLRFWRPPALSRGLPGVRVGRVPVLVVKNPPANAGDMGSTPGLGRSLGIGNGNPLQYSYLENSMDRGAWGAIVHEAAKNWT